MVNWVKGSASDITATARDVRVMNLWTSQDTADSKRGRVQSMLTIIPEATSALAGLGISSILGGGLLVRRRMRTVGTERS